MYIHSSMNGAGKKAFTALEMLVVVLIILVLSGASILSYHSYHNQAQIGSAARELKAFLTTARTLAIAQAGYFQAVIDVEKGEFWIDRTNSYRRVIVPKVVHPERIPPQVEIEEIQINGITNKEAEVRILFRPDATSDYVVIYLKRKADPDRPENYYTIKVFRGSALAHVYPKEKR